MFWNCVTIFGNSFDTSWYAGLDYGAQNLASGRFEEKCVVCHFSFVVSDANVLFSAVFYYCLITKALFFL